MHSRRSVRTTRSPTEFGLGARTGVRRLLMPIAAALVAKVRAVNTTAVVDQVVGGQKAHPLLPARYPLRDHPE